MENNRMLKAIVAHVRASEVARIFQEHAKELEEFERMTELLCLDGLGYKNLAIAYFKSMQASEGDLVACAKYCCGMFKAQKLAAEQGCPVTEQELGLTY